MSRMAPCHLALPCRICILELRKGNKKVVVVVWNNTAYPQTLWKKTPVARALAVQPLPETLEPGSLPLQDKACPDPQTPKLMIRQRRGKLFDELDLSGLDSWVPEWDLR